MLGRDVSMGNPCAEGWLGDWLAPSLSPFLLLKPHSLLLQASVSTPQSKESQQTALGLPTSVPSQFHLPLSHPTPTWICHCHRFCLWCFSSLSPHPQFLGYTNLPLTWVHFGVNSLRVGTVLFSVPCSIHRKKPPMLSEGGRDNWQGKWERQKKVQMFGIHWFLWIGSLSDSCWFSWVFRC